MGNVVIRLGGGVDFLSYLVALSGVETSALNAAAITDRPNPPDGDDTFALDLGGGLTAVVHGEFSGSTVLTSNGRTLAQGALAWIWARSEKTVPIPGFKTVAQVDDNAKAMQFGPLTKDQMKEIDSILGR